LPTDELCARPDKSCRHLDADAVVLDQIGYNTLLRGGLCANLRDSTTGFDSATRAIKQARRLLVVASYRSCNTITINRKHRRIAAKPAG